MKTIYKYELNPGMKTLDLDEDCKILAVQAQRDGVFLWAIVDPQKPTRERVFQVYGTGHPLPDDPGLHLGTIQLYDGGLVLHVFEAR